MDPGGLLFPVAIECATPSPTATPTLSPSKSPLFDVQIVAHTHPGSGGPGQLADHPLFYNDGGTPVAWAFDSTPAWLGASPSAGTLNPGEDQRPQARREIIEGV